MSDKPKKPQKLKARLPRGLTDRGPAEIAATRAMVETIRLQFERYGFEPVETPAIEYTDALGKFLPDQDRPNEGVFSFQDDDEQWLSLRYDLTAPLARYVAENFQNIALPYRSYRFGYVYRNEKPGPGRFRQFMQFDADTVGAPTMAADAEMCMLAADTMEALGIERGKYIVKLNNRKILDGIMDAGEIPQTKWLAVMRSVDKLDRLNLEGVRALLGAGRKDESGDFTKGAGLTDNQIELVEKLWRPISISGFEFATIGSSGTFALGYADDAGESKDMERVGASTYVNNLKTLDAWDILFSDCPISLEGIRELKNIVTTCEAAGFGSRRIRIDSSVVRGLEYYTGPVFEVELLIETKDDKGRPIRFGSVGGGGRYDGLVSRFRGEPVPATGFSIGVSRLQAALTALGKLGGKAEHGPVLVTVFGPENVQASQKLAAELRKANIRAEMYLGNPKHGIGQQLKYADKRSSPCAVIQGPDEQAQGKVMIRDLIAGAAPSDTTDRAEHLKKQAEAQSAVKESDLVEAVRKLLARHKIG
jgi:histidyl-tRNA synthetase